jgi:hypothetical protein
MSRQVLPQRRACETFPIRFWNQQFYVTVGFYPDGRAGEVFIDGGKSGQDVQATARDAAVVLSLALQHGTPLETIKRAISRDSAGNPTAIVGAIIDHLTEGSLAEASDHRRAAD